MRPFKLLDYRYLEYEFTSDNIVLEIGSERGEGSSKWLYDWAAARNMDFYSVDVIDYNDNKEKYPYIKFEVAETGHQWCRDILPTLNKTIKVLYLDNFDWLYSNWDKNIPDWVVDQINSYASRGVVLNNTNSQEEHRLQALYCLPYMDKQSIVLMDDTWPDIGVDAWDGKCATVIPLLRENGYTIHQNSVYGVWSGVWAARD